jgi:hypothetical protein
MGETIDPDDLLIVPRSALGRMPREFRDAIDHWGDEARKRLSDRSGLTVVKR